MTVLYAKAVLEDDVQAGPAIRVEAVQFLLDHGEHQSSRAVAEAVHVFRVCGLIKRRLN